MEIRCKFCMGDLVLVEHSSHPSLGEVCIVLGYTKKQVGVGDSNKLYFRYERDNFSRIFNNTVSYLQGRDCLDMRQFYVCMQHICYFDLRTKEEIGKYKEFIESSLSKKMSQKLVATELITEYGYNLTRIDMNYKQYQAYLLKNSLVVDGLNDIIKELLSFDVLYDKITEKCNIYKKFTFGISQLNPFQGTFETFEIGRVYVRKDDNTYRFLMDSRHSDRFDKIQGEKLLTLLSNINETNFDNAVRTLIQNLCSNEKNLISGYLKNRYNYVNGKFITVTEKTSLSNYYETPLKIADVSCLTYI